MTNPDWRSIVTCILVFALTSCNKERRLFDKIDIESAGIKFENKLTPEEDFNIIDYLYFYNGGGVALGDINGDDLPDIFFAGNQVKNRLYLNKGNLEFEDITEKAGVQGNSTWNTGSVMADVNGDGLLDIYVCAVVGLKHLSGHNELYINNGDNTFTERSAEFGLDFESYSSSAAFLDYDADGDLDLYLLNHAIHTFSSFGHSDLRKKRVYETGDKLMRNDGSKFTDVSEEAGIYGGSIGYGLGVAVADFNVDGYPDIYVGNDFHEDDYLYINNKNGTFTERGKEWFSVTSRFSMGTDAADINHDGLPDLITLDMLAEDEAVVKRSEGDEDIKILKLRTEKYGYNYQFQRNVLQINQGNGTFAETALMSNIAATDWSWSALFFDFDQDGHNDVFISNGIPRRPNDLDYIKYVSSEQVVNVIGTTKLVDEKALALMPSGRVQNYIFKGSGSYTFENKSAAWLPEELTCSTATAVGDLDNDGDLDIVVNNVDDKPGIYINQGAKNSNYIKLKFDYRKENKFGIGTQVYCYNGASLQFRELYTVRGFQASSEPLMHFGFGEQHQIDSIKIVWPNGLAQRMKNVRCNQTLTIKYDSAASKPTSVTPSTKRNIFDWIEPEQIGIDFTHSEDDYTDFDRLKLLPYQKSDQGPAMATGDINNDGLTDVYFGGSKHQPGKIFLQNSSGFVNTQVSEILKDSVKEDIDAVIADLNGDKKSDLFIGTGGADFFNRAAPLLDSYYKSGPNGFSLVEIPDYYENASVIRPFDFDKDGDLDLFVGNDVVSNDFGKVPRSCLLVNSQGNFTPTQGDVFHTLGMITDAIWDDYNKDGAIDLVLVGEWTGPVFLRNENGTFKKDDPLASKELNGLWQSISSFDIDGDGDTDYILGNWGLNSKFKASSKNPMRLYYGDFDENGQTESIVATEKDGKYYPLDGLDRLASQMPSLRKKYTSYNLFAGQSIEEILTKEQLKKAEILEVHELASGVLKNENGTLVFNPLPLSLQISPILAQLKFDFDADGKEEVLLGGNYFGVQPFHGRFASFNGAIIKTETEIIDGKTSGLRLWNNSVRHFGVVDFQNSRYLIVTINNGKAQVYKFR